MPLTANTLELPQPVDGWSLSARRLWEHANWGQVNVFPRQISARSELNHAADFIDLVFFFGDDMSLHGLTLADLRAGRLPPPPVLARNPLAAHFTTSPAALALERGVAQLLRDCADRKAQRNLEHPFFQPGAAAGVLGVPGLFSVLQTRLRAQSGAKSSPQQWAQTIQNFQTNGLRAEELQLSGVVERLLALTDHEQQRSLTADAVADLCAFDGLRLSVIPALQDVQRQLRFGPAPAKTYRQAKALPKAQPGQTRAVVRVDPALGYRVEQVEHTSLWGTDRHWQAVTHDGQVIRNTRNQTLLDEAETAVGLAASHAQRQFPKKMALGRWGHIAWSGGQDYREWLVTLPYWPVSYYSNHYALRNVLVHVRCDVREGAEGERVLLLQEVQSDWAQNARRWVADGYIEQDDDRCPPFMKEWPALALKLMLLHAANQGLDAVAWTLGTHQAQRYGGLGLGGLAELYDRTLPRAAAKLMKPLGGHCAMLGVFVPTNFRIRQTENGYEVYSAANALRGTAPTLEDARQFVPNGAHELLYDVHAVRLPAPVRAAMLAQGFAAWG